MPKFPLGEGEEKTNQKGAFQWWKLVYMSIPLSWMEWT